MSDRNNGNGQDSTTIVMGETASVETYQDFVSLFYDRSDYDEIVGAHSLCGATLLNDQYVLTAAHCLYKGSNPDEDTMTFMTVAQMDDERNFPQNVARVRAEAFYFDASFSNSSSDLWANDIAIIKLERPLVTGGTAQLPDTEDDYRQGTQRFVTIGHGDTSRDVSTTWLLQTHMSQIDNDTCRNAHAVFGKINDGQLCFTGVTTNDNGQTNGLCQGDSGGPVYWEYNGRYIQVGVASFSPANCGYGIGTENITAVYTEIADHQEWIEKVLSGEIDPYMTMTTSERDAYFDAHYESSSEE